jgi:hypothetical protein
LGGNITLLYLARSGFFSAEMKALLQHEYYPGAVAQIIFTRFFTLQYVCAALAVIHFAAETFYFGRGIPKFRATFLIVALGALLFSGLVATQKLRQFHREKYFSSNAAIASDAKNQLSKWHAAAQIANLLVTLASGFYFWSATRSLVSGRFSGSAKFRG